MILKLIRFDMKKTICQKMQINEIQILTKFAEAVPDNLWFLQCLSQYLIFCCKDKQV